MYFGTKQIRREYNVLEEIKEGDDMKEVAESKYLYADIKDEFLKKRIGTTLSWNIRKSVSNKRFYYVFSALSIIAPILVTILHSIDSEVFIAYHLQLYSVILTTVTTVSSSLMALFHFREQWKLHRKLVEQLKAELVNFHVKNNRCGELLNTSH